MDDIAEERLVNDRLRQKLNEVNAAAKEHLAGIQDHINFTLQQAYFMCAYECFDRRRKYDEISNCVERCSVPAAEAQLVEDEMAKFQERLNRSLAVCQDKYEAAKLHQSSGGDPRIDLESCVDLSVRESIDLIPHVAANLKAYLAIQD